eukprot:jgi/Astpho2/486/Aster-x0440
MADAASSTGGSDTGSRGGENDAENAQQAVIAGDDDKDLLKQQGSLQDAVFGVLFTLSKEKLNTSWKYAMAVIILDFLQLSVFNLSPWFPWAFDKHIWVYRVFEYSQLQRLAQAGGQTVFYIFMSLIAVIVVFSGCLCLFVAQNFRANSFPYIWPIKLLRFSVSIFFDMFYVSSLAFLITGSNCKIIHAHPPHWIPEHTVECFTMPHIIIFALGIITGIIAIVIAFFMSIAATDLEPDTKDLLGRAQSV